MAGLLTGAMVGATAATVAAACRHGIARSDREKALWWLGGIVLAVPATLALVGVSVLLLAAR